MDLVACQTFALGVIGWPALDDPAVQGCYKSRIPGCSSKHHAVQKRFWAVHLSRRIPGSRYAGRALARLRWLEARRKGNAL